MAENIFILGAGASAHAGVPLMKDFYDRGIELKESGKIDDEDKQYFETVEEIQKNYLRQLYANFNFEPDFKNIESIFSILEIAKSTNKFSQHYNRSVSYLYKSINHFIVRTIELSTNIEISRDNTLISPEAYDDFLVNVLEKFIKNDLEPNFCIITFNYDIALDFVLDRRGYAINYCLEKKNTNYSEIKLIKLHGSINWAKCSKCRKINPITLRDTFPISRERTRYIELTKIIKKLKCKNCNKPFLPLPIIIPPTWNKTGNYNIDQVWNTAAKELSNARNVYVIGYSFPKTDLFFQYLLAVGTIDANLRKFIVFDINEKIKNKYLSILGTEFRRIFEFEKMKFEEISDYFTPTSSNFDIGIL
ncbi:MAG: hypothetical protein ACTSR3_22030 [Candidatus Helarchaeota archaeon]